MSHHRRFESADRAIIEAKLQIATLNDCIKHIHDIRERLECEEPAGPDAEGRVAKLRNKLSAYENLLPLEAERTAELFTVLGHLLSTTLDGRVRLEHFQLRYRGAEFQIEVNHLQMVTQKLYFNP